MDKDKIQEIRDYAEAAANLMPYEDDDVIFSGIEIMELLDHLASKEAEVERLREALEFYAKFDHYTNVQDLSQDWPHQIIQAPIIVDGGKKARRVLGWEE